MPSSRPPPPAAADDDADSLYALEAGEDAAWGAPRNPAADAPGDVEAAAELDAALDAQDALEVPARSDSDADADSSASRATRSNATSECIEEVDVLTDENDGLSECDGNGPADPVRKRSFRIRNLDTGVVESYRDGSDRGSASRDEEYRSRGAVASDHEDDNASQDNEGDDDGTGFDSDENIIEEEDEVDELRDAGNGETNGAGNGNGIGGTSRDKDRTARTIKSSTTLSPSSMEGGRSSSNGDATHSSDPSSSERPPVTPPGKAFFGNLARAGATFYKTTFKPKPASSPTAGATPESSTISSPVAGVDLTGIPDKSRTAAQAALDSEKLHRHLISMIDAQIATLNGAKAGFVDLQLLKPMTEKTCKVIDDQVVALLDDYGKIEMRTSELEKEAEEVERQAEEEMCEKEQVLIAAKMSLAESQAEVMTLKHDLASVRRKLADPKRQAARKSAAARKTRPSPMTRSPQPGRHSMREDGD
jgi:hypothetical protein